MDELILKQGVKKHKKLFLRANFLWSLLIFLFLTALSFAYLYSQTEKTLEENTDMSVVQEGTLDWGTYRNEEYGFEFKYPSNYELKENKEKNNFWISLKDPVLVKTITESEYYTDEPIPSIIIEPIRTLSELKEEILLNDSFTFTEDYFKKDSWQTYLGKTVVGGREGFQFRHCEFADYKYTLLKNSNTSFFVISTFNTDNYSYCSKEITQTKIEPYDSILSTFKFTNSVESQTGMLNGHVTIGPFCPVEPANTPCPVPPEAYRSTVIVVYKEGTKEIVAQKSLDAEGNYGFTLPAGKYLVDYLRDGQMFDPPPVLTTIKPSQTRTLNFDIDTGIR